MIKNIMKSMLDIINECTFHKLDIQKLPMFDIEFLFLHIRTCKSVNRTN